METVIGALKDLGDKKWVLHFLLPSSLFLGLSGVHVIIVKYGLSNLFFIWSGLSVNVLIFTSVTFFIACLLIAAVLDFATDSILGFFSGVEHLGFGWLGAIGRSYYLKTIHKQNLEYQSLATKDLLSHHEQQKIAQLEVNLHNFPVESSTISSTRIGNILLSAVEYSELRFGINLRATWARMIYSVCPEAFRDALAESRARLDLFLRVNILTFIYILLLGIYYISQNSLLECYLFWSVGLLVLLAIANWCESSAKDYAELIRALYDLYRFDLYTSLRIPLPKKSGDAEIASGRQLSEHLWRGTNEIKYSDIKKTE